MYLSDDAHWRALLDVAWKIGIEKREALSRCQRDGAHFSLLRTARIGEVQLARILATLMNPSGRHGLHGQFLDGFLALLSRSDYAPGVVDLAPDNVIVEIEKPVGETGRLDIIAHGRENDWAIAVELKIRAADQPAQVNRYLDYLRHGPFPAGQWTLVYLTPEGEPPSTASISRDDWWRAVNAGEATTMSFFPRVESRYALTAGRSPTPAVSDIIHGAFDGVLSAHCLAIRDELIGLLLALKTGSLLPEMDAINRKITDKLGDLLLSNHMFYTAATDIRAALDGLQARIIGDVREMLRSRVERRFADRHPNACLEIAPDPSIEVNMASATDNLLVWRREWESDEPFPPVILEGTHGNAPPWRDLFLGIRLEKASQERGDRLREAFREKVSLGGEETEPNEWNVVGRHLTDPLIRDWTTERFGNAYRRLVVTRPPAADDLDQQLEILAAQIVEAIEAVDEVLAAA